MNRYTQISTSQFNPLSLQEMMLAPSAMRKQHDMLDAERENTRAKLLQIQALVPHLNEAEKIKNELNLKLTQQAEKLANEGVNPNSVSEFLALNRNYQEMMAPTGKLGRIEDAYKQYFTEQQNFLEDATINKGWNRNTALANWNKHTANYFDNAFDSNGNAIRIDPLGAVKYVDIPKFIHDYAKDLKMSGEDIVNAISFIDYDKTGSRYVVKPTIKVSNKNNYEVLKNLADFMTLQILNPNTEVGKSIQFAGRDPRQVLLETGQQLQMYKQYETSEEESSDITNVDWIDLNTNKNTPQEYTLPGAEVVETGYDSYYKSLTDSPIGASDIVLPWRGVEKVANKMTNAGSKQQFVNSKEYQELAKSLVEENPSLNAKLKTGKLNLKSQEVQNLVKKHTEKYQIFKRTSKIVDPLILQNRGVFPDADDSKNRLKVSSNLQQKLNAGIVKAYSEDGGLVEDGYKYKVEYLGDKSPFSPKTKVFGDEFQNRTPHYVLLHPKEGGAPIKAWVNRDKRDNLTPEGMTDSAVSQLADKIMAKPGLSVPVKTEFFEKQGLKNVKLKYLPEQENSIKIEADGVKPMYVDENTFRNMFYSFYLKQ